jgi:hypothetical protein
MWKHLEDFHRNKIGMIVSEWLWHFHGLGLHMGRGVRGSGGSRRGRWGRGRGGRRYNGRH